jgi:hypothetical protein
MIAETILASDDAEKSGGLALVGVFTNKTIIYPRNVLAKNINDSRNDIGE